MVVVEASRAARSQTVHSIRISAVRPIDATAERNTVPFPTGPS